MYTSQIDELQQMKWNEYCFRVFITGDYEFLCAAYGISGASGRYPCLFCTITKSQLKIPRSQRNCMLRTLDSLDEKLQEFQKHDDKAKAKFYENVIGERIFNVPLDQVALPALHISLGTFKKFYDLLEKECKLIDLKIAVEKGEMKPSIIKTYHDVAALEDEIDVANEYVD
ncbi:uncharacterized protein [Clytia hemisphaerica]|uniref:uncharacterized protein n=1 Tax=Clytia hemisphaerica TaxID=252671 RepID=UPI0034D76C7A